MSNHMTLIAKTAAALFLATLAITPAAHAGNPAGVYTLAGTNPGDGGEYVGTVEVLSTGETYSVKWDIAGTAMEGTGVAYHGQEGTMLSVAFGGDDTYGVTQLIEQADGTWFGSWVMADGDVQGIEIWTRK